MSRIVGLVTALVMYLALATLVTAASGVVYLRATGKLSNERIAKLLAVARGEELAPAPSQHEHKPADDDHEQTSFDQRVAAASLQARNLELREQALKGGLGLILSEKDLVLNEKERLDGRMTAFKKQLESLHEQAILSGRGNVRQILESMKPKQAKEQILKMLEAEEMNEVVLMLSALPTSKQAKIVSEFKTEEEAIKLGEILRRIRMSVPEVSLIDKTQQQMK